MVGIARLTAADQAGKLCHAPQMGFVADPTLQTEQEF
jgi:hypothetical protein